MKDKCEACGLLGRIGENIDLLITTNGSVQVCTTCRDDINGMNPELLAARQEIEDLRDAIRLMIVTRPLGGGPGGTKPWREVRDADVDGYVAEIRRLKGIKHNNT